MRPCHDGHSHLRPEGNGQAFHSDLYRRGALITAQIPVKLFEDNASLQHYYSRIDPGTIAPVGLRTPLLSNLDIVENIALIEEAHEHMPARRAHALAHESLGRLGYARIAHARPHTCNVEERFVAQLIRASMLRDAKIIIVNPFVMLNDSERIGWIADLLFRLGREESTLILDVNVNESKYITGEKRCRILA